MKDRKKGQISQIRNKEIYILKLKYFKVNNDIVLQLFLKIYFTIN